MKTPIKNIFALEASQRVTNRFRNGREKSVQLDKQTDRHFRIYISWDGYMFVYSPAYTCHLASYDTAHVRRAGAC